MLSRFRQRSSDLENIDTGNYTPAEYEGCLVELRRVNKWLGDSRALRNSLLADIERDRPRHGFSVLDVGAGSGELLRVALAWAERRSLIATCVGIELNSRSAFAIKEQSPAAIQAVQGDALSLPFADQSFDYAISSLFTHHLTDEQVANVLREMGRVARKRIFVIDLHRHPVAYFLYTTIGKLFLHTRLLREDGALSILRSFKDKELARLALQAGLSGVSVKRAFPFRLVLSGEPQQEFIEKRAVGSRQWAASSATHAS